MYISNGYLRHNIGTYDAKLLQNMQYKLVHKVQTESMGRNIMSQDEVRVHETKQIYWI